MASEKALAVVLRTTDWSETSRIATFWTREFGKVRALAKGGRRLKSNFESALDLLTLCSIVFLRKSSGSLDLLTEAQVKERFPRLRTDLPALYAAYYIAELLSDWTEDYDPHPILFDEALAALRELGTPGTATGLRLARFELVMLRELGYSPALVRCAACGQAPHPHPPPKLGEGEGRVPPPKLGEGEGGGGEPLAFSPAAGGVLCPNCRGRYRQRRPLSAEAWQALQALSKPDETWRQQPVQASAEVRQVLGDYVTYLLGRRPRLLAYVGS